MSKTDKQWDRVVTQLYRRLNRAPEAEREGITDAFEKRHLVDKGDFPAFRGASCRYLLRVARERLADAETALHYTEKLNDDPGEEPIDPTDWLLARKECQEQIAALEADQAKHGW
jgi:hypothetical protein